MFILHHLPCCCAVAARACWALAWWGGDARYTRVIKHLGVVGCGFAASALRLLHRAPLLAARSEVPLIVIYGGEREGAAARMAVDGSRATSLYLLRVAS